jgi:hypothetical protein
MRRRWAPVSAGLVVVALAGYASSSSPKVVTAADTRCTRGWSYCLTKLGLGEPAPVLAPPPGTADQLTWADSYPPRRPRDPRDIAYTYFLGAGRRGEVYVLSRAGNAVRDQSGSGLTQTPVAVRGTTGLSVHAASNDTRMLLWSEGGRTYSAGFPHGVTEAAAVHDVTTWTTYPR